jgi:hypothetical protein
MPPAHHFSFSLLCWPSQESLKRYVFPAHPTISPASSMGVLLLAYVPLRFLPVYLYRITGEIIFCFLFCFVLFVKNQITGRGVARDLKGKGKAHACFFFSFGVNFFFVCRLYPGVGVYLQSKEVDVICESRSISPFQMRCSQGWMSV